ncbi:5-aminolevulinate synthase [Sesbania bispinosa]|nr:5-aminolevulinate synthase [Sesbania bispinosa]
MGAGRRPQIRTTEALWWLNGGWRKYMEARLRGQRHDGGFPEWFNRNENGEAKVDTTWGVATMIHHGEMGKA